jgi:hypothetical protein
MNSLISSTVPEGAVGVGVPSFDQKMATSSWQRGMISLFKMFWGWSPRVGTEADSHEIAFSIAVTCPAFQRFNTRKTAARSSATSSGDAIPTLMRRVGGADGNTSAIIDGLPPTPPAASHATACASHPVPVALVGECSIPVA